MGSMTEAEKLMRRERVVQSMFQMELHGLRDWQQTLHILDVPPSERIAMLEILKREIDRMLGELL